MKYRIIIGVIFIISVVFNFFINESDFTTGSFATLSQFFGSMVLGYVVSMFVAKYKVNDWRKYWSVFYGFMVGISILSYVLNFVLPGANN
jgi:hypothetical protein